MEHEEEKLEKHVGCCRVHMRGLRHNLSDDQINEIAKRAHGFVGADLASLCDEAAYNCLRRAVHDKITDEDKVWVSITIAWCSGSNMRQQYVKKETKPWIYLIQMQSYVWVLIWLYITSLPYQHCWYSEGYELIWLYITNHSYQQCSCSDGFVYRKNREPASALAVRTRCIDGEGDRGGFRKSKAGSES